MEPLLKQCPVCLQPWDVPIEAQVLTTTTALSVKAALDVMLVALYGDDPEWRAWAEMSLRDYAAIIRRQVRGE